MSSGGQTHQSPTLTFEVHDASELISLPTGIGRHKVLAGLFPAKTTLYPGEQCPLTLKLYSPQRLHLSGWGMPEPIKDNCLAWRFSLPPLHELSQVHINGVAHVGARYQTTLSGISPGTATFGPSKLRLIVRQRIIDPRFGSRITDTPVPLTLPALSFQIIPFPQGAPADFNGAVGQFALNAQCEKLSLDENDSTEVILRISGTGNLENLKSATLSQKTWKIIDSSKVTRGDERRSISGTVTFRQIIRPLGIQPNIPAYSFSYFNPEQHSYHTLTTPKIPVSITRSGATHNTASTAPSISENINTRPEDMRQILGLITHPITTDSGKPAIARSRAWHIAPALLGLILLSIPILRKIKSARTPSPDSKRRIHALKKLASTTDTRTFYRRAGRFIDQYIASNKTQKITPPNQQHLQDILTQRDTLCYQPHDPELAPVQPDAKKAIIKLLKQASRLTLCLLLIVSVSSTAEASAPPDTANPIDAAHAGQYQHAINLYQQAYPDPTQTPADILYNIGNCHHRLDQPGRAALAWQRALIVDPTHWKARKNLRFVEIAQGSQVPNYQPWQRQLTRVPPHAYQIVYHASLWLITLLTLTLICLKLKPLPLTLCIILLIITPVIATLTGAAYHSYPDHHSFAPLNAQAVTLQKTSLYTEAHRQEMAARSLPPASLVHIIATRGPWTHVETTDGESAWVVSEAVARIVPNQE